MGGLLSRFHEPEDADVSDMVFHSRYEERMVIPAFHGPLEHYFSCCPYCRGYFFRFGELPIDCYRDHVAPTVHGGA